MTSPFARRSTLALLALFASTVAHAASAARVPYEPPLPPDARTQILVLGTPHLGAMKTPPAAAAIAPLLDVLEKFGPDVIGVERIPPDILLSMQQRGAFMAEVAQQFGGRNLDAGRRTQAALGISAAGAANRAKALLQQPGKLDTGARQQLIASMLASYDYGSAALQWSYLPAEVRQGNSVLPQEIAAMLEKSVAAIGEEFSIAVALAHRRGLQTIEPIDDQTDAVIVAEIEECFPGELETIERHPETKALQTSASRRRSDAELEAGLNGPQGLLPFYRYINSPEAMSNDVAGQWGRYFRTKLQSGVDRSRVAQWETRNLLIAAHIRQATALRPGKRMLVVIGAAHKPFLDAYLAQMLDVHVVQLEDLIRGAQGRATN